MQEKGKIGLFVSALLEDEWNKGGEIRPSAVKALRGMAERLGGVAQVVCPGLIETPEQAEQARRSFLQEEVELVLVMQLCFTQGIIPLRALLDLPLPILIWNSQLLRSLPADAGWDTILINSGVTGIPELTGALLRSGREFHFLSGHFEDPRVWRELEQYITAARALKSLSRARVGVIGHPYKWMTDVMSGQLEAARTFGVLCDHIEESELAARMRALEGDPQVQRLAQSLQSRYRVRNLERETYLRSVRYALATEQAVREHGVQALSFFEQGLLNEPAVGLTGALGMSLLFEKNIPCTSEADLPTALLMLLQQQIAGASTFLEHYGMDFEQHTALMAHDSFGNLTLAAEPSELLIEPSIFYRGEAGYGAALRFRYRSGEVTLASLFPGPAGAGCPYRLIAAEGSSLEFTPRPIPAPQMLFRPDGGDINAFYERWCTFGGSHHLAGCYGRHGGVLRKLAALKRMDCALIP
jgi:L-arabinose isomerase